jgi:hypothetical protein
MKDRVCLLKNCLDYISQKYRLGKSSKVAMQIDFSSESKQKFVIQGHGNEISI